jgi:hypothetical protein
MNQAGFSAEACAVPVTTPRNYSDACQVKISFPAMSAVM